MTHGPHQARQVPCRGISRRRFFRGPDVPSLAEAGYPEIGKDDWVGVFGPTRTPKEIVIALNRSIATIITSTDATEHMTTLGFEPLASTPEEFGVRIGVEIDTWAKMIRATNIKAE